MTSLSITWALWLAAFKGEFQYRINFLIGVVMGLAMQCASFLAIWVMLHRFQTIGGWHIGEVMFLYSIRLIAHALSGSVSASMFWVETDVRQGRFDYVLVRPLAPILQVFSRAAPSSLFGDLAGGVALFIAATFSVSVSWTVASVAYLLIAILGGALIETAIRMACAALTFRNQSSNALLSLVDNAITDFGGYPMNIFGNVLRVVLTFALPLAFIAYFPAATLLSKTNELHVHPIIALTAPLTGVALFALALVFFQHELKQYQSAGN